MKSALLFLLLMVSSLIGMKAQFLETTNLPIILINTGGNTIENEPKVKATMSIIDNGPGITNSIDDPERPSMRDIRR